MTEEGARRTVREIEIESAELKAAKEAFQGSWWKCPKCRFDNPPLGIKCLRCGTANPTAKEPENPLPKPGEVPAPEPKPAPVGAQNWRIIVAKIVGFMTAISFLVHLALPGFWAKVYDLVLYLLNIIIK